MWANLNEVRAGCQEEESTSRQIFIFSWILGCFEEMTAAPQMSFLRPFLRYPQPMFYRD